MKKLFVFLILMIVAYMLVSDFSKIPGPSRLAAQETTMPKFTSICEGEKGWLQCKQYELVEITDAFWGRDDHATCPKVPAGLTLERLCETNRENTLRKINGQCRNEQACELVASNIFFDDNTCGNVFKYVKVKYRCIPEKVHAPDVSK